MSEKRVQFVALTSSQNDTIPEEYIRPDNEKPGLTTYIGPTPELPTVDLYDEEDTVVKAVSDSCREWGIFQVVNHGIPVELIRDLQEAGKAFFDLPSEEKELYAKPVGSDSFEGYGSQLNNLEGHKGWGDHLFHKIWPPSTIDFHFWPRNPPLYREINEAYTTHVRRVTKRLLRALSVGLGLNPEEIWTAVGGDDIVYLLKINYYPPCPQPEVTLGVLAHSDMSTLTVLVPNQVTGLQIFKDDHWFEVPYLLDSLIIHGGDQLKIVSNGIYPSVLHRTTVNRENSRMSWPVFVEPPGDCIVGPIPMLVNDESPAIFKNKRYKDYAYCKRNKIPQ